MIKNIIVTPAGVEVFFLYPMVIRFAISAMDGVRQSIGKAIWMLARIVMGRALKRTG